MSARCTAKYGELQGGGDCGGRRGVEWAQAAGRSKHSETSSAPPRYIHTARHHNTTLKNGLNDDGSFTDQPEQLPVSLVVSQTSSP